MESETRACPRCGQLIYETTSPRRPGRPRRWCSARCRRAASEERRAADSGAIAIRYVETEVSIEAHVEAVLDSPAACRRVLRELGERAAGGQLKHARWGSVLTELQRLRQPADRSRNRSLWAR
jgi:endogenous inhibitor of DNA gyrase (YacG/DUF329 family)